MPRPCAAEFSPCCYKNSSMELFKMPRPAPWSFTLLLTKNWLGIREMPRLAPWSFTFTAPSSPMLEILTDLRTGQITVAADVGTGFQSVQASRNKRSLIAPAPKSLTHTQYPPVTDAGCAETRHVLVRYKDTLTKAILDAISNLRHSRRLCGLL